MKAFVHVLLVAACLIACTRALPGGQRESFEDSMEESMNYFSELFNRMRQNLYNFWSNNYGPDITDIQIPEGANTTSTVKVINGHVVTVNETTYTSGDELGGTAFRIRIIDVKPLNETIIGDVDATPKTVATNNRESVETVEDFNNEISKNGGDPLNA